MLFGLKQFAFFIPCAFVLETMPLVAQTATSSELASDLEHCQAALKANNQALAPKHLRGICRIQRLSDSQLPTRECICTDANVPEIDLPRSSRAGVTIG
jgi:hypothetical protein